MTRNKRSHRTGFGYIGFGNNHNVFNQTNNKVFSSLKDKLNKETYYRFQLHFSHHKLTHAERQLIKNKIRKSEKQKTRKAFIFFGIAMLILGYFIKLALDNFVSR